jgi:hypothetical protein
VFIPKKMGHNALMTEPAKAAVSLGSCIWGGSRPAPGTELPFSTILSLVEFTPKKLGHNAMMTESAKAAVSLGSWFR